MTVPGGDRIKELSNTSGTSSFVLSGAVSGDTVRAFASSEDGQPIRYVAKHVTAQEAEVGVGIYTHSTRTLTRIYRSYPSEGAVAVAFSSGGVHVANTVSVRDILPWLSTSDPTVNDDVNNGFIRSNEWLNTVSGALFKCNNPAAGAADWDQINAAAGGALALGDLTDVGTAPPTARHLIQANGTTWEGILASLIIGDFRGAGVETLAAAFAGVSVGADATPSFTLSNAATYALTAASQLHTNSEVRSHQASVDFEVPQATGHSRKWLIKALHDGCTVSVNGDVGSVNGVAGGSARLVNGGVAIVEVQSNAGTEPVVLVRGDVIVPAVDVGGVKTYDNDDSGQDFRLTSTSTQTFGAAANYAVGFYVNLFKETTGDVTIDGLDADYVIQPSATDPAVVTVMKVGAALIAFGSGGTKVLDAA